MKPGRIRGFALFAGLLLAGADVSVSSADNPAMPISRSWVVSEMVSSGVRIAPGQLELLSSVTATESNPRLKLISVEALDGESSKVRLQCKSSDTCLPFLVIVHWGQAGKTQNPLSLPSGRKTQPALAPEEMLVRSGKPATLVFEGAHFRVTLPVRCLQNGGQGQRVKVISTEGKRTYLGRVTGRGIVTSVLSNGRNL
jgi:hypothetical protein